MVTPARDRDRQLTRTAAAILRMVEGMDRREGSRLARLLVGRAIADAGPSSLDEDLEARPQAPDSPRP